MNIKKTLKNNNQGKNNTVANSYLVYDMTNETYTTVYTSRYYIEDAYMNEDACHHPRI